MLEFEGINYWAVIVAWVINVVVGALWYSPKGFAKSWQKHTNIDIMKLPESEATRAIIFVALSAVFQAFVLAVIIHSLDITSAVHAAITGIVLWLGLTAATTVGVTLYSRRTWKFLWLNSSYFLIVMTINSVIFAIWQ